MSVAAGSTLVFRWQPMIMAMLKWRMAKQSYPAKLGQAVIARVLKSGR